MKKTLTLVIFLIGVVVWVYGQSPATYNSSGTFTVPAGLTSISVQAWGGGAGGGGSTNATGFQLARAGAGGGGGAYASNTLTVTPGVSLNLVVGALVNGVSGANGPNGNPSTITGYEAQIYASGGSGGTANTSGGTPLGGAGGVSGPPSAGTTTVAGGNGGNGATFLGAPSGAGGNGANGGGAGGASVGGILNTAPGNPGAAPGGGGSGGRTSLTSGAQAGGAGAAGRIIITWTCPSYSITTVTVTASPNPGNGHVATVQTTGLPEGTYTVSYTFSTGVSPSSGSSAMTVNGSGVGTFNTVAVSGYTPSSTITITNLSSGTTPGICSNAVNSSAALPVTWLSFRAALNGENVQLVWSTASESNNEGFEVQRSENGRDWQSIAFVQGAGTTSEVTNYSYTDRSPFTVHRSLYYRLEQRDYDGTTDYSPVRVIQLGAENDIRVFPNPADEAVTVAFAEPMEKRGTLQLFNHNGRLVAEDVIASGTSEHTLRVAYLPAGTYMLRVVAGAQVWTRRVVVE